MVVFMDEAMKGVVWGGCGVNEVRIDKY